MESKKVKRKLELTLGRTPTLSEVAANMNMEPDKIQDLLTVSSNTISLESFVMMKDGNSLTVKDFIEDKSASPEDRPIAENLKKDINLVLKMLKGRESGVLKMRFGLDGQRNKTLEEIGRLYGVTKECIRQTAMRAIKRIRNSDKISCLLKIYL